MICCFGFASGGLRQTIWSANAPPSSGYAVGLVLVAAARVSSARRLDLIQAAGRYDWRRCLSCMLTRRGRARSGSAGSLVDAGAPLAQSAERLHGKEKVYGSIP